MNELNLMRNGYFELKSKTIVDRVKMREYVEAHPEEYGLGGKGKQLLRDIEVSRM